MKIVVLDGYTANPGDLSWDGIGAQGELTVYDRTSPEELDSHIGDAEAVFTNKTVLSAEVFAKHPQIRYVGVLATGYNVVDIQAATAHGITVTNVPAYSTPAVAQHTMALILELANRVGHHARTVEEGRWQSSKDYCYWDFPLTELSGKTLGIIGFGAIGQAVGRIAKAMGMYLLVNTRRGGVVDGETCVPLERILRESDIITLHCPLTAENQNLLGGDNLSKLKDGVWIINTARGGLLNDVEVAAALESGKIGGLAADVLTVEPPKTNPLLQAKNTIITPHIAWATYGARQRLLVTAAENLKAFLNGTPQNVVS